MKATIQKHIMHNADGIGLYVGTYHKYNCGSTDGAYFDMTTFADAAEFFSVCKELHDDEAEPELMVQDCQNVPSWMYRESMSAKQVQEIIDYAKASPEEKAKILCEVEDEQKTPSIIIEDYSEKAIAVSGETYAISEQLKALGGAWNKFKKVWFISKKKREAVEELVNKYAAGIVAGVKERESENALYKNTLDELLGTLSAWDKEYEKKHNVGAVKVAGKYYLIDKPSIETQFCFHDEGPDYEYYKTLCNDDDKMKAHFISANLRDFDRKIKQLKEKPCYIDKSYDDKPIIYFYTDGWDAQRKGATPISEDQKETLLKALEWGKAQFKKRLESYLKRYGTSKLHTWTYWADA